MSTFIPESLRPTLAAIASILKERNETVAVAETATGGLISACILAMPGASAYYVGGLTLYSLESRNVYAGWTEENIKNYKGPTLAIVAELAQRVQSQLSTTYVICESGIAGPTGGRSNKPPGYAALAVATKNTSTLTKEVNTGNSDRESNMVAFAEAALKFFLDVLNETPIRE